MKKLLLTLALLLGASAAHAGAAQSTTEVLRSSITCIGSVAISTVGAGVTPTDVVGSTVTIFSYVAVQNEDSTANLRCSEWVNVSSTGVHIGWRVQPNTATTWVLPNDGKHFYCVSDSTYTARASICRGF